MDGWMDGWMDEWMDGVDLHFKKCYCNKQQGPDKKYLDFFLTDINETFDLDSRLVSIMYFRDRSNFWKVTLSKYYMNYIIFEFVFTIFA